MYFSLVDQRILELINIQILYAEKYAINNKHCPSLRNFCVQCIQCE